MSTTNNLGEVAPLVLERFAILVVGPRELALEGQLGLRDPAAEIEPHMRRIHEAAAGGGELVVDVTQLAFVNSAGLRVFLDWLGWLWSEPPERRYSLKFRLREGVSWQAASFPALVALGDGLITTESV